MELQKKIGTNTWDNIDDFMLVMNEAKAGNWHWFKNTRCKYVELRADAARLDWLADPRNDTGHILLPRACVEAHPESMRAAIDMAMGEHAHDHS